MKLLLLFIILISLNSSAQNDGWQNSNLDEFSKLIMKIEQKTPSNTSYSFESDYVFYNDLTTNVPAMKESTFLICSKGEEIYLKQFSRYMVQNKELNVICDTLSNTIVINDPQMQYFKKKTTSDFAELLNSRSTVKEKKEGNLTKYILEFPKGFTYLAAEIWIENESNVKKYILYTANEYYDDSDEEAKMIQPRMEITFKNQLFGNQAKLDRIKKISDYIIMEDGEYKPHSLYSDYELIDLRTLNN
jgi:hypothetical protein